MRYHNVSFMSQSCLHFLFIQSLYSFFNLQKFFFTSIYRETFVSKTSILFELYGHMYCYYNVLPEAFYVVDIKKIFRGTYLR